MSIAERIFHCLRTTGNIQTLVECVACTTVNDVLPVVCGNILIHIQITIVAEEVCIRRYVIRIIEQSQLILPLCVVVWREHIHSLCYALPAIISIVAHVNLTALTALCCNEDNTVCTTATVNSGRRSVLQYCDVFDVACRNIANALNREAVDDIKRVVTLGDRTTTTHADLNLCVRRTLCGRYLHTGHLTGKCLRSRCHRHCLQGFAVYCCHRTGEVFLANRTVTDYDNVVQRGSVVLKNDVQTTLSRSVHNLSLHTNV